MYMMCVCARVCVCVCVCVCVTVCVTVCSNNETKLPNTTVMCLLLLYIVINLIFQYRLAQSSNNVKIFPTLH